MTTIQHNKPGPSPAIERMIDGLFPGARVLAFTRLGPDREVASATGKIVGYGDAYRIDLRESGGRELSLVFHMARADGFGHERRADRVRELTTAYDAFSQLPCHVKALDIGGLSADGRLISTRNLGEPYLLTTWAEGKPYADDLRRFAHKTHATHLDLARVSALASYLAALHQRSGGNQAAYRRCVRDLVGDGEGIFGVIDGYPADTPGAPTSRLRAIEAACVDWRWRLRGREGRLSRKHGDFHPFNIVFDEGADFTLLDASRGILGEPADDVTALAMNFVFFAADQPGAWHHGLGELWLRFWSDYLKATGDDELLEVAPPWLAWRLLVVANPVFYPHLSAESRDALLCWAEDCLEAGRMDLTSADRAMARFGAGGRFGAGTSEKDAR